MRRLYLMLFLVYQVHGDRNNGTAKRQFGIFSVVQFPNNECTTQTDTTVKGVCMSADDCGGKGGVEDGNCASGFGVCCRFTLTACGGTVSQNITYIRNPEFPSSYGSSTACKYTVKAVSDGICQLRLEFDTLQIGDPDTSTTSTKCSTDTVAFDSPSGYDPPTLCGTISGQHLYMETASKSTAATITFTFSTTTTTTRKWDVKISQIPCHSNFKAPKDCGQYYTGASGKFTSLNYNQGNGFIQGKLLYRICFRREAGYCSIIYSTNAVSSARDAFEFNPSNTAAKDSHSGCKRGHISIKADRAGDNDQYCGDILSSKSGDDQSGNIYSDMIPFGIDVATSDGSSNDASSDGFSLTWYQHPCGNFIFNRKSSG